MNSNQKLELTWIGKEKRPKLEPRILIEDPDRSYGDGHTENMLIFGDNLLALKALEQDFAGSVKCIFIDPPYNTGSAFAHYDDGLEHSLWLTMMRDRLEILRRLLAEDGSIWITIDDNEAHYLKVLCDEVFGRGNFVANCLWQKVYSERMDARGFSVSHDHIMVYQKTDQFIVNPISKNQNSAQFGYFDQEIGKYYRRRSLRKEGSESKRQDRPSMWYPIAAPDGSEIWPVKPDGTEGRWRWKKENVPVNQQLLEYIKKEARWEIYVKQYLEENPTRPPATFWPADEVGHNHEAKLEVRAFNREDIFDTPKPERLLERVLSLATNLGDLVLDSFAGSGTTGAVAHKMGRRWIMVELGEHCHTHILPRMKKVCDGTDQGGISQVFNWQGGGGFKYYDMAPSLLQKDRYDQWVINADYNAPMLAAAMAKHENFRYSPDEVHYWKQGQSSEKDFIFTTTVHLTPEHLDRIHEEMQLGESLLICCKSHFDGADGRFDSITVKKIPSMLLGKCEFGRDDYSLNIVDMPRSGDEPEFVPTGPPVMETGKEKKAKAGHSNQMSIFEGMEE
ncbi:MAG: site-specific DNA-methyltransferase [Syntrophales bacterium]|jgi:adenine-specific DNA-methyltransferase|nr:site-specific DNA-methyltransferase [Syntrophales bacterium]